MNQIGKVINAMISYYKWDLKRINHFLKVYGYAKAIGELEKLNDKDQDILEVAAITHDIGIKVSEQKYGSCEGKYQEAEGPAVARELLSKLNFDVALIERVCYLIGHHHTYHNMDGMDYQILVEADFLVNLYEDNMPAEGIKRAGEKIFKTKTGLLFLKECFNQEQI